MILDDLERPKRTLEEKIVLRSPPEKYERRQRQMILVGEQCALMELTQMLRMQCQKRNAACLTAHGQWESPS